MQTHYSEDSLEVCPLGKATWRLDLVSTALHGLRLTPSFQGFSPHGTGAVSGLQLSLNTTVLMQATFNH